MPLRVPSAYVEEYEKQTRPYNPELAHNYIRHTTMGHTELDPAMEETVKEQKRRNL
ncbi:MAG: hypothetical protein OXE44_13010 [Nitrospinae bacterium]|nr:hypothetical protein [Nitrospinota bacterium]